VINFQDLEGVGLVLQVYMSEQMVSVSEVCICALTLSASEYKIARLYFVVIFCI